MNPAERYRLSHSTPIFHDSGLQPVPVPPPSLFAKARLFFALKHTLQSPTMLEKLKSRKLIAAVLTAALVALGDGLGLSHETTKTLAELASVYIIGQGAVDAVTALKQ